MQNPVRQDVRQEGIYRTLNVPSLFIITFRVHLPSHITTPSSGY